ncbi:MAG: HDOD domain-containing protein [Gammaproteobacteria bacterium]|nr:HDOD domain-containing protein [Gammaproteobacteria bacterium]
MPTKPDDLVNGVIKLISLPEIFIRVNQVMDDPNHNAKQLGDVISHDPSLTARILRIVNSSYYALVVKIEIVSRAISVIGEDDLRNLVLATSAVDSFKRIPNELVDIDLFWRHSVHTGIIAKLISRQCNILHGERLFVAGLLHDIGKLILYAEEPELSQKILLRAAESDGITYSAEKEILGFTHADVGGALIKAWQLSDTLSDTIKYHHDPLQAKKHPLETAIVHIANCVVNALEPGMEVDEYLLDDYAEFEPETLKISGFKLEKLPQIMDKAWEQAAEVLDIICPKI